MERIPSIAVARYGLGAVFLTFGIMQLIDPAGWLGYIPGWANGMLGLSDTTLILMNGTLDLIIGALLIIGVLTRIIAIVATAHLAGIIVTLGFNDVAVRDGGMLIVAIAIALNGPDDWCLRKREWS